MQYLCLVYHETMTVDTLLRCDCDAHADEILEHREELQQSGHYIASSSLQRVQTVATIRVRNGKVSVANGSSALGNARLGGFYLIEARDLNEAIRLASKMPPAGRGCIEVWPLEEHGRRVQPSSVQRT